MQPSHALIDPAGNSRQATSLHDREHASPNPYAFSQLLPNEGFKEETRLTICESLRDQINKWLAPAINNSVRLTRCTKSEVEYVRADIRSETHPRTIFFFRHPDDTWQVYPPCRRGPTMHSCAMAQH
jgi:hypothetical protein